MMFNHNKEQAEKIAALEAEIDQLRVQLAGCSVAACGNIKGKNLARQGDYGWSAAYQDVLNLRKKYETLKKEYRDLYHEFDDLRG